MHELHQAGQLVRAKVDHLHYFRGVQAYLVDMRRDFAAFNTEYNHAFGALKELPTRTTVEVAELPPGGRIAVELKVVAHCAEPWRV